MTTTNTDLEGEEKQYKRDKKRLFITEFLMISIFSAFVLYCFWHYGK
jgi:hypothetical protein